ncbi:uncharacterized protein BX663DRAFT_504435 [Cokeromyces recurvatus]|uniref:uncharacterized protein n=1 Tax=Cokeromyces recurvatus TaxID=90255 RepID=UPI002220C29F|nr:uncharacterized protein BX663DRAFT_504435 [Cokeromyces recurvatus]KAI7904256.1 hypothetical protein BX663DRAFT_504435 [Cokeromyces recurvatus]
MNDKLYFFLATESVDGLETFIYLLELTSKKILHRISFTRKIKGEITNIYVSGALKNNNKDDYYIATIGTKDSAIYVFRFTMDMILSNESCLACALLRTDAKNALTQHVIVHHNQSKSPANVYVVCGGFNGIIDFFLLQGGPIQDEPKLEFNRHQLGKLPSQLPIVGLQYFHIPNNASEVLFVVIQKLINPVNISLHRRRSLEPSLSVIKLDVQNLIGKQIASTKFTFETHILPLILKKKGNGEEIYESRTCSYVEEEKGSNCMITACDFNVKEFQFGEKLNTVLKKTTEISDKKEPVEQIAIIDKKTCWILYKEHMLYMNETKLDKKRHYSLMA